MAGTKRTAEDFEEDALAVARRQKLDYSTTFTVLVGPEEVSFTVHKDTISARSPFFAAACSERWQEGREIVVRLPTCDADDFKVYIHWTYTGKVETDTMPPPIPLYPGSKRPYVIHLGKIWILAHYLQDIRLCDRVIDCIILRLEGSRRVATGTLQYLWEHTGSDSSFRHVLTDHAVAEFTVADFDTYALEYPQEIIHAMARRFVIRDFASIASPASRARCRYHVHGEGIEKCS